MTDHDSDLLRRAKELFGQLVELDLDRQREAIAGLADAALADRVVKLLEAHARATGFLSSASPAALGAPTRIGPYRILQIIGEGAFGRVYMADQLEPVKRRVALKVLKKSMDSAQVIARFEAERQALAIMDHPGIARVFDAGTTPDGLPYFVMELVNGLPITQYCDQAGLDLKARMSLLGQVARAVHHAHQKGVIHRDLKPSNVLVTQLDGKPIPKVIDFGIAKAMDRPLTDRTLFTEFRVMVGTPEYMSPEQAEIGLLDIDVRSDVYGLGVLLYELLVGAPPFDGRELRSKAFGEMQRIIREVEPPAPSTRLTALHAKQDVTSDRTHRTPRELKGEPDWIVMKCLEKDRNRRYDSAAALAEDLESFLQGDAVAAGPPSVAYRLRKTLRRNRALVATVAAVVVALSVGLASTLVALRQARYERDRAALLADQARREARRAEAAVSFLTQTIQFADPYRGPSDPPISRVFDQAVSSLDAGQLVNDPDLDAAMRTTIGSIFKVMDRRDEAIALLRRAAEFRRSQSPRDDKELARTLGLLAAAEGQAGHFDEAASLFAEARAVAAGLSDRTIIDRIDFDEATFLIARRDYEQAVKAFELQVAALRASPSTDADALPLRLEALAMSLSRLGRHEEALKAIDEAITLRREQVVKDGPRAFQLDRKLIEAVSVKASALGAAGRPEEAVQMLQQGINDLAQSPRPFVGTLTMLREMLGRELSRLKRSTEAVEQYEQVVQGRIEVDGPNHERTALARASLGLELYKLGRQGEAREQWRRAWFAVRDRTDLPGGRADVAGLLAMVSSPQDDPSNRELYDAALASLRTEPSPRPMYANTLMNAWLERYEAGDYASARALSDELKPLAERFYAPGSFERSQANMARARSILRTGGDLTEARTLAEEALEIRVARSKPGSQAITTVELVAMEIRLRQGEQQVIPQLRAMAEALLADPATSGWIRRDTQALLDEINTP